MSRLLVTSIVASPLLLTLALGLVASGCDNDPIETPEPVVTDPAKLGAPAPGKGFQFGTQLFPVDPNTEVQNCYFFKVRDLAAKGGLDPNLPVNLHRVEIVQKAGSHHMNIFRVAGAPTALDPSKGNVEGKNGQSECFKSSNWAAWPLVANTQQTGELDWTFPDGVANVFQPDEWLMLQSHYVNASSQKTDGGGQVAVNFHTIAAADVKHEMGTLFATNQNIRVCKTNPTPSFESSCSFKSDQPIQIIGANGHFHGRGKSFKMFNWDGKTIASLPDTAKFYESAKWDEPPMMRSPELNITVPPGGGVRYSCEYQWTPPTAEAGGCAKLDELDKAKPAFKDKAPDCCYTFGPIVERNEHCNAFVYYYPKQPQGNVNCF